MSSFSARVPVWAVTMLLLVASACGGQASAKAEPPAVLPASAVPYLPSSFRALDADALAKADGILALSDHLDGWGFRSAAQRTFQGQSQKLQIVVSRTVDFDTADGARQYLDFLQKHVDTVYGQTTLKPLSSDGRTGVIGTPQACACHMASASILAMLRRGSRVTFLELTGPKAGAPLLRQLERRAP
jgi:hypothetical protein